MATLILKSGASPEPMHSADLERRHQQAKARDRDRKRIEVHAGDGIQRPLRDVARVARRLVRVPTHPPADRKPPSRKWPEPQVGSIIRTSRKPNSRIAGVSVRSRMNSSTNSGVCSSA